MPLFLQLRLHVFLANGAVFQKLASMILPSFPHAILLMEPEGSDTVPRFRAEDAEDGALSSWHNGGRLLMSEGRCKEKTTETEE